MQVKKKEIQTWFWKQKVIQLIDVSQKIMYEMALGEKRLYSLLNATVSHEMRNPTNSIQALVQEQQKLNLESKQIVDQMKSSDPHVK